MFDQRVSLHPEALEEAQAAYGWYSERDLEVGDAFLSELDTAIAKIIESPKQWSRYIHGTRRYFLRRFPYFVIFRVERKPLVIVYFVGQPGWHNRLWESEIQLASSPIYQNLISDNCTLHISVDTGSDRVYVQEQNFQLTDANVFVVVHVDRGKAFIRVVPIGRFELDRQ